MANDFFTVAGVPVTGAQGLSSVVRAEFASIASGFDKMPAITGFPLKAVVVNGAGTALTLTAGSLALAGNFTTTGAFNLTLVVGATVSVTMPIVTGLTLATLTGTEIFTNKTLTAPTLTTPAISNPVFSGASTGTLTLVGATITAPAISSPAFSGTSTGTLTLVGATLPTPSISNPAFSGTSTGTLTLVGATLPTPSISNPAFSGTSTGTLSLVGATLPSPVFSGTATGTYTLAGTPTITAGVVTADPVVALGIASKQYVDAAVFSTGDIKMTLKTVADTSWVLMNDTTIGNASSNATGRANADTSALFTLIYANFIDQWCKIYTSAGVLTTRGANAAADYAANKALELPKTLGRALAGYGVGSTKEVATTSSANGLVVQSNNTKWVTGMTVVVSALSGFGGTITATTYFLSRVSSTNIRFATTLALAQAGTPDITITGTGSATVTYTFTSRAIGEQAGEEAHAQSITELLAHTHTSVVGTDFIYNAGAAGAGAQCGGGANDGQRSAIASAGGNAGMNIMSPTVFLNIMVKL